MRVAMLLVALSAAPAPAAVPSPGTPGDDPVPVAQSGEPSVQALPEYQHLKNNPRWRQYLSSDHTAAFYDTRTLNEQDRVSVWTSLVLDEVGEKDPGFNRVRKPGTVMREIQLFIQFNCKTTQARQLRFLVYGEYGKLLFQGDNPETTTWKPLPPGGTDGLLYRQLCRPSDPPKGK